MEELEKNIEECLNKTYLLIARDWKRKIYADIQDFKMSPIEGLFYIGWKYLIDKLKIEEELILSSYCIYPQKTITIKNKQYKVDFLIHNRKDLSSWNKDDMAIVELDSYLWHGQTPEQFEKEKKRERNLIQDGWQIMRFSGKEVLENPIRCAGETFMFILDQNQKKRDKIINEAIEKMRKKDKPEQD